MSGLTQYLIESPSARAAVDDRHVRAGPVEIEGRLRGGVLAADDDHPLAVERVRRREVVRHVRQVFAGHAHQVRESRRRRWPGRRFARAVVAALLPLVLRLDDEDVRRRGVMLSTVSSNTTSSL